MVLLDGNKYACETCIKGHRSSTCRHTDRPLFEIKKKGRPVTQCDHCRELRKTKQVHVKCICQVKDTTNIVKKESSGTKKGHTKIPDCATFPQGLPQALGASVAESVSGPDNGGKIRASCRCASGAECHCCVPRKSAPKQRKKDAIGVTSECPASDSATVIARPSSPPRAPSHILARLAELRPVLPRPSRPLRSRSNSETSHHDPSSGSAHGHAHGLNRRVHEFSPYGRAYDANHEFFENIPAAPQKQDHNNNFTPSSSTSAFPPPPSTDVQLFRDQLRALEGLANSNAGAGAGAHTPPTWIPPNTNFPSMCGCGDTCRCPGCVQHNPDITPASSAFSSCMNPNECTNCLDCTILSLPASAAAAAAVAAAAALSGAGMGSGPASGLPADTALSIYDDGFQAESIDEWIRQVSSLPRVSPVPGAGPRPDAENIPLDLDLDHLDIDIDMDLDFHHNPNPNPNSNHTASGTHTQTRSRSRSRSRNRSNSGSSSRTHGRGHHNPEHIRPWEGYLPPVIEPQPTDDEFGYSVKPCCGVLCKCDPETCECEVDDGKGYDCRREMLLPTFGAQAQVQGGGIGRNGDLHLDLGRAICVGRGYGSCCGPQQHPSPQHQHQHQRMHEHDALPPRSRSVNDVYFDAAALEVDAAPFFGYADMHVTHSQSHSQTHSRSRSSSTSTSSSRSQSQAPTHSPGPGPLHTQQQQQQQQQQRQQQIHTHLLQSHLQTQNPNSFSISTTHTHTPMVQVQEFTYPCPWAPGRVVRGPYYAGQGTSSVSSPNLGLQLQTELANVAVAIADGSMGMGSSPGSRGSSPGSVIGTGYARSHYSDSDHDLEECGHGLGHGHGRGVTMQY